MPRWLNRYVSVFLAVTILLTSSGGPLWAASGNTATSVSEADKTAQALSAQTDSEEDKQKGKELSGLLNTLLLTGSGSSVLVKVISAQLRKYGNQRMASWARESYYLVGQAVGAAERTGSLSAVQGQKAQLYQQQFGKILKEAGWIEKIAMKTVVGSDNNAYEAAAYEGRKISRRTYQGEVANLKGEGFINDVQAREFIDIQNRGIMTPRELGGFLLKDTQLQPAQVAELLRTYRSSRADDGRVRVSGGRDSRYDAAVLELLDNWKGKKYARFSSQTSRELAAKYLNFQGDVNDFTKLVMSDNHLSGLDSAKLIDEFAMEAAKDQAFFKDRATLINDAKPIDVTSDAKKVVLESFGKKIDVIPDGPSKSGAPSTDATPKAASTTVDLATPKAASTTVDLATPKASATVVDVTPKASATVVDATPKASATVVDVTPKASATVVDVTSKASATVVDATPKASATVVDVTPKASATVVDATPKASATVVDVSSSKKPSFYDKFKNFKGNVVDQSGWKEVKASISSKDGFLGYKGKWTGGGIEGIKESLKYDAFRGGLFVDVGISAVTGMISRMGTGESFSESLKGTVGSIASIEFVFGDLLGGTLGAALGAAIPLPAALQTMGAFGRFLGVLPGVSLAIAGSQFGFGAVSLLKRGQFSLSTLFNEVKPGLVIGQAIGAAVGMTIGTMLLPGPIGAMLGGIVGGMIGSKIATLLFGYKQDEALAQMSHTVPVSGSMIDVDSNVGTALDGIDINYPDTSDMKAVDEAVKEAYSSYIRSQKSGNYQEATAHFKTYTELQRILNVLLSRGYRVK
jgi:hypothetical protein